MKSIAISREYGSGGREIAAMLSKELGIPYYDRNLLLIAAEKHGINTGIMEEFDEKKSSSLLYGIAMLADGFTNQERILMPYKVYQAQKETILRLAGEGSCIFVGRCADQILKENPDVIKVFLYASSMDDKIERAMMMERIGRRDASGYIAQRDRERKDYYYFHTGQEWADRDQYDLCLNTSTLGYQGCVDILKRLARA